MAAEEEKSSGMPDLQSIVVKQDLIVKNTAAASSVIEAPDVEAERILSDAPRGVEYKDQFVAFIDLLGFRQIVMRTSQHRARADEKGFKGETRREIYGALSSFPKDDHRELFWKKFLPNRTGIDGLRLGVAGFSDTLIFWCDEGAETFGLLIHAVFQTVRQFTLRGFYCRGGIKFGEVFVDEEGVASGARSTPVIFGPAFIQAYDLEQKHAHDARIILCNESTRRLKEYIDSAEPEQLRQFFSDYLFQAHDGPWQINIFADIGKPNEKEDETLLGKVQEISSKLTKVMEEYTESPTVYRKLLAVAKEFNAALKSGNNIVPGLDEYKVKHPSARH